MDKKYSMLFFNEQKIVIVGKLLSYKRYKILWDVLLPENNQLFYCFTPYTSHFR